VHLQLGEAAVHALEGALAEGAIRGLYKEAENLLLLECDSPDAWRVPRRKIAVAA
jgi:hypothetical protein